MITVGMDTWKTQLLLSVRTAPSARLETELRGLLTGEVARLDRLASRFRDDSELSAVNARAGEWVEVSWAFVAVLTASLDAAKATGGLVDPTLGRAVKAAGYDDWAGQQTSVTPRVHTGVWRSIGIRPGRFEAQVRIGEGSALDLGSIAKAWLADRLATAVRRSGFEVCANMGGDVRVIADRPWTVWSHAAGPGPGRADSPVDLTDGAVATSGIDKRAWTGGHHLIDPRTGTPAQTCWHTVSAVAGTAAHANAAATAGMILGEQGPAWMTHRGLDARFVGPDRLSTTGRWPLEVAA